jgi:hypothetical protein
MTKKRSGTGHSKNSLGAARPKADRASKNSRAPKKNMQPKIVGSQAKKAKQNTDSSSDRAEHATAAINGVGSATGNGSRLPVNPSAQRLFYEELPHSVRVAVMTPALLKNESIESYFGLMRQLAAEMQPRDILEWLWVKDFTDYTWDILRYRRWEKHILANSEPKARHLLIQSVLDERGKSEFASNLQVMWNRSPDEVAKWLSVDSEVMSADAAIAQSFLFSSAELERIARMRANAELRRSMALRQLEERREFKTVQRLRQAAQTFEDSILEASPNGVSVELAALRRH